MGNYVASTYSNGARLAPVPSSRRARRNSLITPGTFVQHRDAQFSQYYEGKLILGRGSFGRVVECEDRVTKQNYAVKIISRRSVRSEVSVETFVKEVEVLKELDHPNIMKIHEYFQDEEYFYLVGDLYSGGELFDEIVRRVRFPERAAIVIMRQILSGIAYMHDKGVVHRDLKPENILLERERCLDSIKIIDFGLASYFDAKDPLKDKTGTAYYIAPEVVAGKYCNKCDIWSAGVILYILISGCPPFFGGDEKEILRRVSIGKYTFKIPQFDEISSSAKDVIRCMLFYYASDRPSAKTILDYAWMNEFMPKTSKRHHQADYHHIYANMLNLKQESRLTQMVMLYAASKLLTSAEVARVKPHFERMDYDRDGRLSRMEIREIVRINVPAQLVEPVVAEIFETVDFNQDSHIEISEFLTVALEKHRLLTPERLKKAFQTFSTRDPESVYVITPESLWNFLKGTSGATQEECVQMVSDVGDGHKLRYDVFLNHVMTRR